MVIKLEPNQWVEVCYNGKTYCVAIRTLLDLYEEILGRDPTMNKVQKKVREALERKYADVVAEEAGALLSDVQIRCDTCKSPAAYVGPGSMGSSFWCDSCKIGWEQET